MYPVSGVFFRFLLGMTMALVLNQEMRFRKVTGALVLLSWSAPVVVGCFTWRWIVDDVSGSDNVAKRSCQRRGA